MLKFLKTTCDCTSCRTRKYLQNNLEEVLPNCLMYRYLPDCSFGSILCREFSVAISTARQHLSRLRQQDQWSKSSGNVHAGLAAKKLRYPRAFQASSGHTKGKAPTISWPQ
eukprot:symbB.v1.2.000347.t1/scaffold22.1/size431876/15